MRSVFGLVCLMLLASATAVRAQEYQLKAAFLYNFAKQVEWPSDALPTADAPLNVCALNGDSIASAMQSLDGKAANTRKIATKTLTKPEEVKGCHIIFFCESSAAAFNKIKGGLANAPILTVGEQAQFAQEGGIAALVKNNNKITLKLNLKAAQDARLKLSPQLVKLAGAE